MSNINGYNVVIDNFSFFPQTESTKGVLNNINLNIRAGEFVSIIGRNGHGKTSIMRAIAGELDEGHKTNGIVKIGNILIDKPINEKINGVGIVHQFVQFDLIDTLSISKNIQIRQLFSNDREIRNKVNDSDWIANTNTLLSDFIADNDFTLNINYLVNKLSGGQRQLLNVLIALKLEHSIKGCKLLLLDEHLTSLDVITKKKVMDLIESLTNFANNRLTTIIMVTHDFDYALKYSDKIIVIHSGSVKEQIIKNEKDKWVYSYLEQAIS